MADISIELLSLAVVREYLSRKGYRKALTAFDKESTKKDETIQNRRKLAEELKIIDLVKANKVLGENRLQSFVEMIILFLITGRKTTLEKKRSSNDITDPSSLFSRLDSHDDVGTGKSQHCQTCSCGDNGLSSARKRRQIHKKKDSSIFSSDFDDINKDSHIKISSIPEVGVSNDKQESSISFIEGLRKKKEAFQNNLSPKKEARDDLIVDSLDDDVIEVTETRKIEARGTPKLHVRVDDINLEIAINLKTLIFGTAKASFNQEWRRQGFYFSPLLKYGLVQEKGGPCGLLASVQAWVLKFLLVDEDNQCRKKVPNPSTEEQTDALIEAMSQVLWIVRSGTDVVVAIPSRSTKFNASAAVFKTDNLTEKLDLYMFDYKPNLKSFLKNNYSSFRSENGLVLFLYSVILSRGIENIVNNMDDSKGTLLGCHGYCTQEMVNLLLTGRAVSNVFDGVTELGDKPEEMTILHGINSRSQIGFFSLFEHYNSCLVGNHYKTPLYPIWVVCSESHFSVLFAITNLIEEEEKHFDLYYFDGLGQQDEEIRLSITPNGLKELLNEERDLIPPIDHCIRTKWKMAKVCWNETDPIL